MVQDPALRPLAAKTTGRHFRKHFRTSAVRPHIPTRYTAV